MVNGVLGSAPADVATLSETARRGAADAISTNPSLAPALLAELFDDPSPDVRREASRGLQFLSGMDVTSMSDFIDRFLDSDAFQGLSGELLDALEDLPGELPAVTWEVCRRVLGSIEGSSPKGFVTEAGQLIAVLVRIYRSSDDAAREMALDLIDRTVQLQLWRVDQILDEAR